MGYKFKFTTRVQNIMERSSGLSEVKCETCKQYLTNAQLSYSMRLYGKPLCRTCQSLEYYRIRWIEKQKGGEDNEDY
jgi:formylmethanofuran dehydrogenase subunit E